jgi:hypothetical protein
VKPIYVWKRIEKVYTSWEIAMSGIIPNKTHGIEGGALTMTAVILAPASSPTSAAIVICSCILLNLLI